MSYRKALSGAASRGMIAPAAGIGPQPKSQQQAANEAQQMLASFGSRILEMLKAGGQKLDNFDRAYVNRVKQDAPGESTFRRATTQVPLGDVMAHEFAYGGDPRLDSYMNGMVYGAGAANLASRYALPAGGVTLAGKGMIDIINELRGSEEDEIR